MTNSEIFMNRLVAGAAYTAGVVAGIAIVSTVANEINIRQNRKATLQMSKEMQKFTDIAAKAMSGAK